MPSVALRSRAAVEEDPVILFDAQESPLAEEGLVGPRGHGGSAVLPQVPVLREMLSRLDKERGAVPCKSVAAIGAPAAGTPLRSGHVIVHRPERVEVSGDVRAIDDHDG